METLVGILTALVAIMILSVSLGALALVITGATLPQIPRPKPRKSSKPAALVATITPDISSGTAADVTNETEARSADDEATTAMMSAESDDSTEATDQHDAPDEAVTEADKVDTPLVDSLLGDDNDERTAMASEIDSTEPIPLAAPDESLDLPSGSGAIAAADQSETGQADAVSSAEEEMDRPTDGRSANRSRSADDQQEN